MSRILMLPVSLLTLGIFGICLVAAGCSNESRDIPMIGPLRIAVLPDRSRDLLTQQFDPLLNYLGEELEMQTELIIPKDYAEILQLFADREVDLAWLGGLTFVRAQDRFGAQPIILRDVDLEFTSAFVTSPDSEGREIEDFEGQSFAFGSSLSTSGHLMPRAYLRRIEIEPEDFFGEVRYSGSHEQTLSWVRDGVVELGVANGVFVEKMFKNGRFSEQELRVIKSMPPYVDYVWAASADVGPTERNRIRDAFLELDFRLPEHAAILEALDARAYFPASERDFQAVRAAAELVGLLEQDNVR